jgi:hypothetical protein
MASVRTGVAVAAYSTALGLGDRMVVLIRERDELKARLVIPQTL